MRPILKLQSTVVQGGYCVGCGVCAAVAGSPLTMSIDEDGQFRAELLADPVDGYDETVVNSVCPFSDAADNEDVIAARLFDDKWASDPSIGRFLTTYAGHVAESSYRELGSSGGFGSWISAELIRLGHVDRIIHVVARESDANSGLLFSYEISGGDCDVRRGAKSRYYPIEMSQVLKEVRECEGRYALIGIPCFVKAVRLLQKHDPLIRDRIKFCIGLVCGHLKSARYADSLAWQMGICPDNLKTIDFRTKRADAPADQYAVSAGDGETVKTTPVNALFGSDWGAGAFKYQACDFCDDVFAETADLTLGDAWLPEYLDEPMGTNILVVRHAAINEILIAANVDGRISISPKSAARIVQSQEGGLKHRRDAIGFRLHQVIREGRWAPTKRYAAKSWLFPAFERERQTVRTSLRLLSHRAFSRALQSNSLQQYLDEMKPLYRRYKNIRGSFTGRLVGFLGRKLRRRGWK